MAIRQRGERWQVYWTNPFSKRRQSVTCASEAEAQKTDALIKYRLKWEPESFREETTPKRDSGQVKDTFGHILFAYLRDRKLDRTAVGSIMCKLKIAIGVIGDKRIHEIGKSDIVEVMHRIMDTGVKQTTIAGKMQQLKAVFRWAHKTEYIESMPAWPDVQKGHYEHFVPPTRDEVARMLEVATPAVQRAIIIGITTGVRIGPCELFKLRWDDVDWEKCVLRVHAAKKNKNEPWREVPLRKAVMPILERWHNADQKYGSGYIVHYFGKQYSHGFEHSWRTCLNRAGITRRIRPYDLRHAFATEALAAGADVGTVARLMGHADVTMCLRHYQHVMTSQKRAVVEALPDLEMCQARCAKEAVPVIQ